MRGAPSCPRCGYRDGVEPLGEPIQDCSWYCGPCNLVFAGSDSEWHRGRLGGFLLRDWREHNGKMPPRPAVDRSEEEREAARQFFDPRSTVGGAPG